MLCCSKRSLISICSSYIRCKCLFMFSSVSSFALCTMPLSKPPSCDKILSALCLSRTTSISSIISFPGVATGTGFSGPRLSLL
eukprot:UN33116